jgi:hypothetical protein
MILMEELASKLTRVLNLIKAIRTFTGQTVPTIPSIKPPSPPSMTPKASGAKIPGISPNSNKNPKKIAEQIKDGSMSTKTQKALLKRDQWSDEDIEKMDKEAEEHLYHIHDGPHRITAEPLSLKEIKTKHGGVLKLENSGFRLIRHQPESKKDIKTK